MVMLVSSGQVAENSEQKGVCREMEKKGLKADHVLDCRKMSCPIPVLKTKNAISKMGVGEVLEMISTDPGSLKDIEAWARQTGQELLEVVHEDSQYRFYIKKVK